MAIDFLNPLLNISKGIGIGHVVHDNNPMCASIVGGCDAVGENQQSMVGMKVVGEKNNYGEIMCDCCWYGGRWIGSTDKEEMKNFGIKILTFEIALVQLCPRFAT